MIQVTFPVNQEEIPVEAKRIRAELSRLDAERKIVVAMLRAIQDLCEHGKNYTKTHYDGSTSFNCEICGYSS